MSSTHLSLHVHLIFGTKNHEPFIAASWRPRLHAYIGGILTTLEMIPEGIGGVGDHVHVLAGFNAVLPLADTMRKLKASSSKWVHDEIKLRDFAWQEGYGAFTVSPSQRGTVKSYIEGQEKHHRTRTFKDEYLEFLKKSGVEFDPRYV